MTEQQSTIAVTARGDVEILGEGGTPVLASAQALLSELRDAGAHKTGLRLAEPVEDSERGTITWLAEIDPGMPVRRYDELAQAERMALQPKLSTALNWYADHAGQLQSREHRPDQLLGLILRRALEVPSERALYIAGDVLWLAPWGATLPGQPPSRVLWRLAAPAPAAVPGTGPADRGTGARNLETGPDRRKPQIAGRPHSYAISGLMAGLFGAAAAVALVLLALWLVPICGIGNPFGGSPLIDRCDASPDAAALSPDLAGALFDHQQLKQSVASARMTLAGLNAACGAAPSSPNQPVPSAEPVPPPDDPGPPEEPALPPNEPECSSMQVPRRSDYVAVDSRNIPLRDTPGEVIVRYNMGSQFADSLIVMLAGQRVASVEDRLNDGELRFPYPAEPGQQFVRIIVHSSEDQGTRWCYAVSCPGEDVEPCDF